MEHDGNCNLLNGADHAGCNCSAGTIQTLRDEVATLRAENKKLMEGMAHIANAKGWAQCAEVLQNIAKKHIQGRVA